MQIHHGPPGHRGVSQLLAVGADDYESELGLAVRKGAWLAGGAVLVGLFLGSRAVRNVGAGALVALLGVKAASKRRPPPTAP